MAVIMIYVTCGTVDEAERIAAVLVEKKLVACANIMAPHTAVYEWDGKVETGTETAMVLKTRDGLFEDVRAEINVLHSYECPCIVMWPVTDGHPAFLQWVQAQTQTKPGPQLPLPARQWWALRGPRRRRNGLRPA